MLLKLFPLLLTITCVSCGQESCKQALQNSLNAVLDARSSTFERYLTLDERNATGFRDNKGDAFLRLVRRHLRADKTSGSPTFESNDDFGQVSMSQELVGKSGRKLTLNLLAFQTDQGPKLQSGVAMLLHAVCFASLPANTAVPGGKDRSKFLAERVRALEPELTSTGVTGVYLMGPDAGKMIGRYYSWSDYAAWHEQRASG